MRLLSAGLFVGAILVSATAAGAQDIDWEKVDAALGRKGAVSADVHRYGFPRSDLTVKLDGVTIKPALALGGWVAFKPMHGEVMVMGDLVLLETEVNPVMAKLIENGIEITAVHNHLLRANPAPFYIHVGGHGDAVKMAAAVRTALAEARRHWKRLRPQRPHRPSISTSSSSTRLSAPKVGRMAGCTNSRYHAAKRSAKTEWLLLRQARWEWRPGSTFSRQAAARRRYWQ